MGPLNSSRLLKIFIFLGILSSVCGTNLRCYEGCLEKFSIISLDEPEVLLNSTCYQAARNTVIYAFGFQENATDYTVQNIVGKYLELNYNALLLDWGDKATVPILGSASYGIVVLNVKKVAEKLGKAIVKLAEAGFSLPSLHLLGFSLGAQLMGYAGKEVKKNNMQITNMTVFDPAGPLYEGPLTGVDSSSAEFVVVVHGNPGHLGTDDSVGTVDFWPNCGNSIQPGCEEEKPGQLPPDGCSHNRAWMYYLESLDRKTSFPARAASSCGKWKNGEGTDQVIYMGDYINRQAKGTFYLRTDSEAPFGLGESGSYPKKEDDDVLDDILDDPIL